MRKRLLTVSALSLVAAFAIPVSAAPISADFRTEFDLPDDSFSLGSRVFEALSEPVAGAPDLDASDEIANPSRWRSFATTDLDASGLITLTGDVANVGGDYDLLAFTISDIVFDAGESIIGVDVLSSGLLMAGAPSISFTGNSVSITYDATGTGSNADFLIVDGGISTFQLLTTQTAVIPLPAAFPMMLGAVGVLGFVRLRRRQ